MRFRGFITAIIACIALQFEACDQAAGNHGISLVFYNCENFFDTIRDPSKNDIDFTPGGSYHYTTKIYEQKLHNIATVLQSMGEGKDHNRPALIGLAEIENETVIHDLVQQPEIARNRYRYIIYPGTDLRGINIALLYNPDCFHVITSKAIHVDLHTPGSYTRDVLYVEGILLGDTVHVLVNHWPSRRGGENETDDKRSCAALTDKKIIGAITKASARAKIIVMGDFNDNPTNNSITNILGAVDDLKNDDNGQLFNPWTEQYKSGKGTEWYDHHWNLFDQILLSGKFLTKDDGYWHYKNAEIYNPAFMKDHHFGKEDAPYRSFAGTHWINGYSDHVPVIVHLENN